MKRINSHTKLTNNPAFANGARTPEMLPKASENLHSRTNSISIRRIWASMSGFVFHLSLIAVCFLMATNAQAISVTVTHGLVDNFVLPTDLATPSMGVASYVANAGAPLAPYDDDRVDAWFGDSFTLLPTNYVLTSAKLTFALKPNGTSLNSNDAINLGIYNNDGTINTIYNVFIGSGNSNPGLLPSPWDTTNFPNGQMFMLDLAALPLGNSGPTNLLPLLNLHSRLDIVIQDDTSVDYMRLDYNAVPELSTFALLSLSALMSGWFAVGGRARRVGRNKPVRV